MKRIALYSVAAALASTAAFAAPKAIFVKNSDGFRKYSFGVASPITFSPDHKTLRLSGYDEELNIADIEYMSFDMPKEDALTSVQQKDRLIEIGEKINAKINANDVEDILGMCTEFDNITWYDDSAFGSKFKLNHPDLFDDDDDYRYESPVKRLLKAFKSVAKGDATASRAVTQVFNEVFSADDFTGIFSADHQKEAWVKTAEADYFELNYTGLKTGKKYSLRITPSKDISTWKENVIVKDDYVDKYYGESDDGDTQVIVALNMPKSIAGVMTVDGKSIATANLHTALDQSAKTIKLETEAAAAGKYIAASTTTLTDNGVSESLTFTINGETVLTQNAALNGNKLLDIQDWIDAVQGTKYEDEWEISYEADIARIAAKLKNAKSEADILGELQIVGNTANFLRMQELLDEEDYDEDDDEYSNHRVVNHDKGTVTYCYDDPEEIRKEIHVYNTYTDASFYYDGKPQLQGFISYEIEEYLENYGTEDGEWDYLRGEYVEYDRPYIVYERGYNITPLLTFSDGSSFAFDSEFFTGNNFNVLVNDYESIMETVKNIIESFRLHDDNHDEEYYD